MEENLKQLLLIDLCARLPYGVKCDYEGSVLEIDKLDVTNKEVCGNLIAWYDAWPVEKCKLYLRPMSSMTEEEYEDFRKTFKWFEQFDKPIFEWTYKSYDWLNKHHFDYRGLIPMGLALEATKDMYKID